MQASVNRSTADQRRESYMMISSVIAAAVREDLLAGWWRLSIDSSEDDSRTKTEFAKNRIHNI